MSQVTEQDSVTIPEWLHSLLLGDTKKRQGERSGEREAESPCPSSGECCSPLPPAPRADSGPGDQLPLMGVVLERVTAPSQHVKQTLWPLKGNR